jgi:hypothetical protein
VFQHVQMAGSAAVEGFSGVKAGVLFGVVFA